MIRNLTHQEEQVIRLVHHDFKALTVQQAARVMQISQDAIRLLLHNIKEKAPQLFPILTQRQTAVLRACENGLTQSSIAAGLNLTELQVKEDCNFLYKHKFLTATPATVRYEPGMDGQVVQRF